MLQVLIYSVHLMEEPILGDIKPDIEHITIKEEPIRCRKEVIYLFDVTIFYVLYNYNYNYIPFADWIMLNKDVYANLSFPLLHEG